LVQKQICGHSVTVPKTYPWSNASSHSKWERGVNCLGCFSRHCLFEAPFSSRRARRVVVALRDTLAIASDAVIQRTDGFMGYSVCYVAVSRRGDDKVYCDNVTHLTSIFITWAMRGWVDTRQKPPSDPITREFSDVIVHDVVYSTMHTSKHNPMKCKSSSLFRPPFEGIASLTFSLTLYCGVAILSNLFVCTN
jgi:hypothetical protein